MHTAEFGQWYYMIFLIPGGMALLLIVFSTVLGGAGHGHHVSAPHAGHVGSAHATNANQVHVRPGHVAANHPPAHHGTGQKDRAAHGLIHAAPGHARSAVSKFFRTEEVPVTLVWASLLLSWGVVGLCSMDFCRTLAGAHGNFAGPGLVVAGIGTLVFSKLILVVLAKIMPQTRTFAVGKIDLIGLTGVSTFQVDDKRGRVHVTDTFGTLHVSPARVKSGRAAIEKGQRVLVVDCDPSGEYLEVEPVP